MLVEDNAGALDSEVRQDAILILKDLRDSFMPPAGWTRVGDAVAAMAKAIAAADQDQVRAATITLELLSPRRTEPMGDRDDKPPKNVHDEIVDLIQTLGGDQDRGKDRKPDKSAGR